METIWKNATVEDMTYDADNRSVQLLFYPADREEMVKVQCSSVLSLGTSQTLDGLEFPFVGNVGLVDSSRDECIRRLEEVGERGVDVDEIPEKLHHLRVDGEVTIDLYCAGRFYVGEASEH